MTPSLRRRDVLLGLALILGARPVRAAPNATPGSQSDLRFNSGVVTHFIQTADSMDHALDLIRDAGFTTIRDEVYWGLVELERNKLVIPDIAKAFINGAVSRGITPLLTLDYGNPLWDDGNKPRSPEAIAAFARYAGTIATEFAGKVRDYEVWNEWVWRMGNTTPGSPEDYINLFVATRDALRLADPHARAIADQVVIGDLNEALVALIAARGFFRDLDGITVHPYFFNRGNDRTPEAWAKWMLQTDDILRRNNAGVSVPLYVTEVGWPSHMGRFGVSRERQGAMAMRLSLLARTMPFVQGVWWYDFRDDGTIPSDIEQNFGLVTNDFKPKPALAAVAEVNHLLTDASFSHEVGTTAPKIRALSFRLTSGEDLWACWLTAEQSCQSIRLQVNGDGPIVLCGSQPGTDDVQLIANETGHIRLALTERPLFLRGSLGRAELIQDVGQSAALAECRA